MTLDKGRAFPDGNRILGDGKTVNGTAGGIALGTLGGIITVLILKFVYFQGDPLIPYYAMVLTVACGALAGDIVTAFCKRRVGLARGASAPVVDQLGFILVAFLFAYIFNLYFSLVQLTVELLIILVIVTPFIHLLANFIGYKIGRKSVPW
jgi:CDP-2,3-bis-(O-geranylgeranyl)-sn-glycerol synthase